MAAVSCVCAYTSEAPVPLYELFCVEVDLRLERSLSGNRFDSATASPLSNSWTTSPVVGTIQKWGLQDLRFTFGAPYGSGSNAARAADTLRGHKGYYAQNRLQFQKVRRRVQSCGCFGMLNTQRATTAYTNSQPEKRGTILRKAARCCDARRLCFCCFSQLYANSYANWACGMTALESP